MTSDETYVPVLEYGSMATDRYQTKREASSNKNDSKKYGQTITSTNGRS